MTPIGALPPGTFAPRLSPDGRRVAFDTFDGSVWIAELANLAAPQAVRAQDAFRCGRPTGSRLLFAGPNGFQLYWQATDGSGTPELIAETARAPESWSRPRASSATSRSPARPTTTSGRSRPRRSQRALASPRRRR